MNAASEKKWRECLLIAGSTLENAIQNLDSSKLQICVVVNSDGKLLGTITDGDIRRGLLKGKTLSSSACEVMNESPLGLGESLDQNEILNLMNSHGVKQIPIINPNQVVVGLYSIKSLVFSPQRENVMVIMAGGKGERLRPLTENCPKPLLSIAGKPILEHIILKARNNGFSKFIISVNYLGDMIRDYFSNGSKFNVSIDYLNELSPLGTAGSLSLLESKPSTPILVSNGDVITDINFGDFLDFHDSHHSCATMAVRRHEWTHPFGVVQTDNLRIVGFEEKPIFHTYINAGIYALNPESLNLLVKNEYCDMPELFKRCQIAQKNTLAFPMYETWMDIGMHDDFEKASKNFK